jgi:hypothetical protein
MIINIHKFLFSIVASTPIFFLLRDLVILNAFGFYITITTLQSFLIIFIYSIYIIENGKITVQRVVNISNLYIVFITIVILSLFYANDLLISTKIKEFLDYLSVICVVLFFSSNPNSRSIQKYYYNLLVVMLRVCFLITFFVCILQYLGIWDFNILGLSNRRFYVDVLGLSVERLFVAQFLAIGVFCWSTMKKTYVFYVLLLLTFYLLLVIGSFTALIAFIITFLFYLRVHGSFRKYLFVLLSGVTLMIIYNFEFIFQMVDLIFANEKIIRYFFEYQTSNIRFILSIAILTRGLYLTNIIGYGHKAHEQDFSDIFYDYQLENYNIVNPEKFMNAHTIFSVVYDQGIIAFFVLVLLIFLMGYKLLYKFISNNKLMKSMPIYMFALIAHGFTNLLFYYQSDIYWTVTLAIISIVNIHYYKSNMYQ